MRILRRKSAYPLCSHISGTTSDGAGAGRHSEILRGRA